MQFSTNSYWSKIVAFHTINSVELSKILVQHGKIRLNQIANAQIVVQHIFHEMYCFFFHVLLYKARIRSMYIDIGTHTFMPIKAKPLFRK